MNEELNMEKIRSNDETPVDTRPEDIGIPVVITCITGSDSMPRSFCLSTAQLATIKPETWPIFTTRLNDLFRTMGNVTND